MVVGTQNVDQHVVTTLALVEVVGDVRGEVGLDAVVADDHAILVVTELRRAEPGGAILDVEQIELAQALERSIDGAALREGTLGDPVIEVHPVAFEIVANFGHHLGNAVVEDALPVRSAQQLLAARDQRVDVFFFVPLWRIGRERCEYGGGWLHEARAVASVQASRHGSDVIAAVAVLREGQALATGLEIAHPHRHGQDFGLSAGIVDVVLADHFIAGGSQQRAQCIAECSLSSVADVQRSRGVGGDELEQHFASLRRFVASVAITELVYAQHLACIAILRQMQIDEPGTGDFGAADQSVGGQCRDDGCSEFARVTPRGLGKAHRHVGGEIAMLRIAGTFDGDRGDVDGTGQHRPLEGAHGGLQKFTQLVFHGRDSTVAAASR